MASSLYSDIIKDTGTSGEDEGRLRRVLVADLEVVAVSDRYEDGFTRKNQKKSG